MSDKGMVFWDIESYDNLFCVGMIDQNNHLEMHYLVDDPLSEQMVLKALADSHYQFTAYNLAHDARRLCWHFTKHQAAIDQRARKRACQMQNESSLYNYLNKMQKQQKFYQTKPQLAHLSVDPDSGSDHNYYFGYNTLNYDLPLLDQVLKTVVNQAIPISPKLIREWSDAIIQGEKEGRHNRTGLAYAVAAGQVDCSLLNEKMVEHGRPTVGLKTLVGIRGGSIIESESNHSGHSADLHQDILYNINDVSELRDVVFPGLMEETFKIRQSLLEQFPALAEHGLTVNSTSANFVECIVAPDKAITDDEVVSFMYPAKHVADKLKVPQTNVLEDTKNWYLQNIYQRVRKHNPTAAAHNLLQFMSIYHFYKEVEGNNWNESALQKKNYPHGKMAVSKHDRHELFNRFGTFLPLIDQYGHDTGTYVNFSLGGIHGAEIFVEQLNKDRATIKAAKEQFHYISKIPNNFMNTSLKNLLIKQSRTRYRDYPDFASHEIPALYQQTKPSDEIIDPAAFSPFVCEDKTRSHKEISHEDKTRSHKEILHERYKYTSAGKSIHQDFAGYYPMLLINLGVFYDGHGKDPYNEVYQHRLKVKKKLKSLKFASPEYVLTDIEQLGYKLILNSASGILDAAFDTKLRANNKAMAMRCIGQMFTYRIAAALAIEGARIPSSNTDGIYVFDMSLADNTKIVDRELKKLYISIDPEDLYLVSKDANNRMEMVGQTVTSARGATLTSHSGARVDNRLAHPALVDKVMTLYLAKAKLNDKVDRNLIRECLQSYIAQPDILPSFVHFADAAKRTFVYMASWIMRSTSGSIFIDDQEQVYPGTIRVWLSNNGHDFDRYGVRQARMSNSLDQYSQYLPPNSFLGEMGTIERLAKIGILNKYFTRAIRNCDYRQLRQTNSKASVPIVTKTKISGLPAHAKLIIDNHSLLKMSQAAVDQIYQQIDLDSYVEMIANFAKTWHNVLR